MKVLPEFLPLGQNELDSVSEISYMNGWNNIISLANNWKSSKIWMERNPSASKEVVEDVILLSIAVEEASTDNMDPQPLVGPAQSDGCLLNCFEILELWERHPLFILGVVIRNSGGSFAPNHWICDKDQDLIFFLGIVGLLQCFKNLVGLIKGC